MSKLKNVQVTFTEEELDLVKKAKLKTTWHDWILERAKEQIKPNNKLKTTT